MLTRDFTCSRNLSQGLAASRSRAGFVADVVTRKKLTLCHFHRCEKAVESNPQYIFDLSCFRRRGFIRSGTPLRVRPWKFRVRPDSELPALAPAHQTARDCRRLKRAGQAKNGARLVRLFTCRAQFFHKRKNCAIGPGLDDLKGNLRKNSRNVMRLSRSVTKVPEENSAHGAVFLSGRSNS